MSERSRNIAKAVREADERVLANTAMIRDAISGLWPHESSKYVKHPVIKSHATLGELEGMQVVKVGKKELGGWWPNYRDFDAYEGGFQLDGRRWKLLTQVDLSALKAPLRRAAQANSEGLSHLVGLADINWPWTQYRTSLVALYVPQGEIKDAIKLHREMIAQDYPMVSVDTQTLSDLNIPTTYIKSIHAAVTGIGGSPRKSYIGVGPNSLAYDKATTTLSVSHQHLDTDTLATYFPLNYMDHVWIETVNKTLDEVLEERFRYTSPWQQPGSRQFDDSYNPSGFYISDKPLSAREIAQLLEKIGIQIKTGKVDPETVKTVDITFRNLLRPEPALTRLINIPLDSAIPSPYVMAGMESSRRVFPKRTNPDLGSY